MNDMSIGRIVCDKELLGSEGIWWSVLHSRAVNKRGEAEKNGKRGGTPTEEAKVLCQGWS